MAVSWSAAQPASPFGVGTSWGQVWSRVQKAWSRGLIFSGSSSNGVRVDRATFISMMGSLATMVDSGVPLYRALHHLSVNAESHEAAQLAHAMMKDLERGSRLSKAAARHPQTFSPLHTGLLKVGESTGSLTAVLQHIAQFEEKNQATLRKIRSALTYPALACRVREPCS